MYNNMDIIKNPVVIGISASIITYGYLYYTVREKNTKLQKKHKKSKSKRRPKLEEVNLIIPLIVGLVVWFLSYGYFEYSTSDGTKVSQNTAGNIEHPVPLPPDAGFRFTRDVMNSSDSDPKSFTLLTGGANGVHIPTVPDVMIDVF
jgi:hypothetical protein